jgi:hypothetical protein
MNNPDQNPQKEISLSSYFPGKDMGFSGKIESQEETTSRLKKEYETHKSNLNLNYFTYVSAIILIFSVSILCASIVISKEKNQEEKKWAETTITIIVSAFAGYLCGKNVFSSK